jgi:hypothetical protein
MSNCAIEVTTCNLCAEKLGKGQCEILRLVNLG